MLMNKTNQTDKNNKKSKTAIDTKSFKRLVKLENSNKVNLTTMVYIFIFCAIIGWLVEVGYVYLINGKIVSRGMTYGPYCSIYGSGALILYLMFHNIERNKKNIFISRWLI